MFVIPKEEHRVFFNRMYNAIPETTVIGHDAAAYYGEMLEEYGIKFNITYDASIPHYDMSIHVVDEKKYLKFLLMFDGTCNK